MKNNIQKYLPKAATSFAFFDETLKAYSPQSKLKTDWCGGVQPKALRLLRHAVRFINY